MARPLLYLLDGHALAYRFFFAQINRPLMTSAGEPTSAIFGFARALMDILEKDKPNYLAVSFDEGLSGRDQLYAEYKGTREKMPDELARQLGRIDTLVRAFNIPILKLESYEADDVMGTVALQAEAQGVGVRIITGDRDLLQLLTDYTTVRLAIPKPGVPDELYDVAKFREKWQLEPHQLIDLKALEGDTSDNIPGVPGIGEKTATALLQQFPSLEAIYKNLDQVKESVRKKLEAGRDLAFLSKDLATIRRNVPITLNLAACVAHDFDKNAVEAIFRELEFTRFSEQLNRMTMRSGEQLPLFAMAELESRPDIELEPPPTLFPTIIVQDEAALRACVDVMNAASGIAFDTETTATDQMRAELVGISLCADGETGYYIPVGHQDGQQLPLDTVIAALRPVMTNPKIPKYAHHAAYDDAVMARHGIVVSPVTFDTMIAEWVRDTRSESLGLKRLAKRELDVNMTLISELIGKGKDQITMDRVSIERVAPYAAADAVVTYQLVGKLDPKLGKQEGDPEVDPLWGTTNPPTTRDLFEQIEMPLVPVLTDMEMTGIKLDIPFLADYNQQLRAEIAQTEQEIYDSSGGFGAFNINSPKQLNDVLFGKLGLKADGLRKTTHGFSTAADVLDNMRGEHPIIEKILHYRELTKLQGTYVEALPAIVHPQTGRVHTSYSQTGAGTGRLSSSNPNLQNIPIRTEAGREVRRAFIAQDGHLLLSVDYSQVELRIMAHVTQEPNLLEAFHQGQDIHAATAALVYNMPLEQVTKAQRGFAKRVNFGLLYGMGAFRLARDSDLTLAEAEKFVETYFARLPGVRDYIDKAKRLAREQKFLTTLFGRRRSFPGLFQGNRTIQQAAEREAINMPIQGTAADIIKLAMIRLHDELIQRRSGAKMLLQVHDELVLEVPEADAESTARLVIDVMENAADLRAPLVCNAAIGQNWRDMTDL